MGKAKKGYKEGESKFDGQGVDFKCKLIGFVNVASPRGDDICQEALTKLKQLALKLNKEKKEHKQRITVNITLKGIRLIDEPSERIEHAHPINRISFISHDNNDKRTFGYIVGTKEGYKLFAIRTMKEAEHITKTLKELFQVVFERHQAQKAAAEEGTSEVNGKEDEAEDSGKPEVGEEQNEELNALVDFGQLNEQIQVMQSDGMTSSDSTDMFADLQYTIPTNDPFSGNNATTTDPFATEITTTTQEISFNPFDNMNNTDQFQQEDPFNKKSQENSIDLFSQPATTVERNETKSHSAELFSLDQPQSTSDSSSNNNDKTDAPLLMNDPFAELKKNINEMHKQSQMQQQQQYGFQQQGYGQQPHGFANQPQQFQTQQNNPFSQNMFSGSPMMQSNQTPYQTTMQQSSQLSQPTNPFQTQPAKQDEPDNGWTVTKRPAPAVRQPVKPSQPADDPFAFLNNQTGKKPTPAPQAINVQQPVQANAQNELLDFLG